MLPHRQLSPSCPLCPGGPGCPSAACQSPGCRMRPGERQNLRAGGLGTATCYGGPWVLLNRGTFFLKVTRRGDDTQSPWQLQPVQGCWGGTGVSWQKCWGMLRGLCVSLSWVLEASMSWSRADFQHFSLLIGVDCLRGSLLSWDCPEQCLIMEVLPECSVQELFKFLNPRKQSRGSGAEPLVTADHSGFASPWI